MQKWVTQVKYGNENIGVKDDIKNAWSYAEAFPQEIEYNIWENERED